MVLFILQGAGGSLTSLIMMGVMFVIFYFFFIRPQMKKQKDQNTFQSELKKGDEVVTMSGIIGKISKIDEAEITLEIDGKTYIRFLKSAISKDMTEGFVKK
jgi:preprotein translocase subunit YajC